MHHARPNDQKRKSLAWLGAQCRIVLRKGGEDTLFVVLCLRFSLNRGMMMMMKRARGTTRMGVRVRARVDTYVYDIRTLSAFDSPEQTCV